MSAHDRVSVVAAHLLWRPMSANEIAARVGMWAPTSIKKALDELVEKGVAIRDRQPNRCGGFRWRYRRSLVRST